MLATNMLLESRFRFTDISIFVFLSVVLLVRLGFLSDSPFAVGNDAETVGSLAELFWLRRHPEPWRADMKVGMVAFGCYEYSVAYQWAARHCDVDFYCGEYALRERDPSLLEALDSRVRMRRFGPYRIRDPRNFPGLFQTVPKIRDQHYDVIHFQEYASPWMILFWRTLRNIPLVMTVHDPYQHPGIPFVQSLHQDVMQNILRAAGRKIIVHGQLLKEQVLGRYRDKSRGGRRGSAARRFGRRQAMGP